MPASLPEWAAQLDRLAPVLLDAAARSLVILSLAGLAATALRRASAATRHWLWLLAFAGLLLIPVFSASLPAWRILPHVNARTPAPAPTIQIAAAPILPIATLPIPAPIESAPTPAASPINTQSPTAASSINTKAPAAAPFQSSTAPVATATSTIHNTTPPRAPLPWTVYLTLIWLTGTLLALAHLALAHISLHFLQRRSSRISHGDWPQLLDQLRTLLSIRRPVDLLITPQRTMPMTWGLFRSHLLLPAAAAEWPVEQRRAVLLHELAHVRRRDVLTQLLAQFACALYWFNPLVWLAWRRMQLERERACDDLVLSTGTKASAYAQHLLQSASAMPILRFVGAAALAMARPSKLESRLHAILDSRRNRSTVSTAAALATFLLLLAVVLPVAIAQAKATRTNNAPTADVPLPPGYPARGDVPLPPGYNVRPIPPAITASLEERMKARQAEWEFMATGTSSRPATSPASEALKTAADKINATKFDDLGQRYAALAALIKPGMSYDDLQMVLPPATPTDGTTASIIWSGGMSAFYPLEGGYAVEAHGNSQLGHRQVILSDVPKILAPPEAAKLLGKITYVGTVLAASGPAASMPESRPATAPTPRSGARGGPAPARGPQIPVAAPGEGPTCTMDATIYELRLPADQIGRLDLDALSKAAATPAAFEKALADLGETKPLYRANQSVRLAGDYIQIGSQVPYVTNAQTNSRGEIINSVSYASTGAIFSLAAKTTPSGALELDLSIQISALTDGTVAIAPNVKPPNFRVVQASHKGLVVPRQPFVVVSADAANLDANGKAVAYIARITLGDPQAPAATAPAKPN